MSGPTASNSLDVCGMVVATCNRKCPDRIYAELLRLHPTGRKETSTSVISRLQQCGRRTAKEKSKTSSK
jgi:hypothetical protein